MRDIHNWRKKIISFSFGIKSKVKIMLKSMKSSNSSALKKQSSTADKRYKNGSAISKASVSPLKIET